jgi:hypothetical protein
MDPGAIAAASLLQCLFSIRSERALVEHIDFNMMYRGFVGSWTSENAISMSRKPFDFQEPVYPTSRKTPSVDRKGLLYFLYARSGALLGRAFRMTLIAASGPLRIISSLILPKETH